MSVQVKRDGEVRETFDSGDDTADQNKAFEYVLKHQGQSVDWATRYEGWEIVTITPEAEVSMTIQQAAPDDDSNSPAALMGDAEVLEAAMAVLRTRFRDCDYDETASSCRRAAVELISRSRHPQRQHLRGGTAYKPPQLGGPGYAMGKRTGKPGDPIRVEVPRDE